MTTLTGKTALVTGARMFERERASPAFGHDWT
jgi:hypothetical protein